MKNKNMMGQEEWMKKKEEKLITTNTGQQSKYKLIRNEVKTIGENRLIGSRNHKIQSPI